MKEQQLTLDLDASRKARDQGMEQVLDHAEEWKDQAAVMMLRGFQAYPAGALVETVRAYCLANGLPKPHHHNAWGAVTNTLVRRGQIEFTGVLAPSGSVRSHARKQPVWRATGCVALKVGT